MSDWKEEIIQNIKDCGQSLINNAEKIANDFEYVTDIDITCRVTSRDDKVPYITVTTEYTPSEYVKRYL